MNYEVLALVREALAAREREERERVHDEVREAYSDKALNLDFDAIVANVAELQGITFTEEQHRHWLEWAKADADALKATAQEESTKSADRLVKRTFNRLRVWLVRAPAPSRAARTAPRRRAARARRRSRRIGRRVTRAGPDDGPPAEPPSRAPRAEGGAS